MKKAVSFLFGLAVFCGLVVLLGIAFIEWFVQPPEHGDWHGLAADLRQFYEGTRVLEDSLRLAEDLAKTDPGVRAASLQALRERAEYQKNLSSALGDRMAASAHSLDSLTHLAPRLAEGEELVEAALKDSPSQPVSGDQAAAAAVDSDNPDATGVVPGTAPMIAARAAQLRHETQELAYLAEEQVFGAPRYTGRLGGLSARRWVLLLAAPAAVGLLAVVVAMRRLKAMPERLLEDKIRRASRQDPRHGIKLCHEQVAKLLDMADKMAKEMGY